MGKQFNAEGIQGKKEILHQQIRKLKILELVLRMIDHAPDKVLEEDRIVQELGRIFPHEKPRVLWKTILSWARYAEVLSYDPHTREVSPFEKVTFTADEAP